MILILTFETEQDRQKFEFIFDHYKNLLYHKAHGILHDAMLAEDASSEAFIRIYKNLHKVEDPASPRSAAFFVTIVTNTALTILKKQQRGNVLELEDEILPDPGDLEGDILADIASGQIYELLNTLEESLRSVFLLKYAYDMSHREIGEALHITENNVTVRLHRAKKKLSAMLVKEGYARE